MPRREDDSPSPALGTSPAATVGALTRSPSQGPRARHLGADRSERPGAEEGAELAGQHVEHPVVGLRVGVQGCLERANAALPVDEGPALLGVRGHRQHDVGASVTADARSSRETTNVLASASSRAAGRPGRSASTPPTTRALTAPVVAASMMPAVSRPGVSGRPDDAPGLGDLLRGRRRRRRGGRRAAARQRAGLERAALTGAAGHPGQACAGRVGQRRGGGQRAGHRGEPLADEDDRVTGLECLGCAGSAIVALAVGGQRLEHLGLGAGRGRRAGGRRACRGRGSRRGRRHTRQSCSCGPPCAAAGRRSATPPRARSPTRSTAVAPLEVGVGHRSALGARGHHGDARKSASSAECGRARKSMSLVSSADAGELAVGVGVLDGHPAADEHADAAGGRAGPRAAAASASGQEAGCSSPSLVAHQRRGEAVAGRGVLEGPAALVAVPLLVDRRVVAAPAGAGPCRGGGRCACAQPEAQCSQTLGVETRSNGRERNR